MRYLLDTCVISDFVKGEKGTVDKLLSTPPYDVAISSISKMEVEYGLILDPKRSKHIQHKLSSFFSTVNILPFDSEDSPFAARVRSDLKKRGLPIGPYDILLAGTALRHGLIMVTANADEFSRVTHLKCENWRSG